MDGLTAEQTSTSEIGTIAGIFFEPGKTFESLRIKPRFILAILISLLAMGAFQGALFSKVGYDRIVDESLTQAVVKGQMEEGDRKKVAEMYKGGAVRAISYAAGPLVILIVTLLGGLLYWLASNAMGGAMTYLKGLSVWAYSSLPPFVVAMLANVAVLLIKPLDDIDAVAAQRGLLQANPSFFIDGKENPVLATLLSSFDIFAIWGLILAAIGIRIVGKVSSGSAWAIVLILWLVGITIRVVFSLLGQSQM